MRIPTLSLEMRWYGQKKGYVRCSTNIGAVINGTFIDKDYFYNTPHQKMLAVESHSHSGDGEFFGIDFGIGRRYSPLSPSLHFIPMVGVSYREIGWTLTDGKQVFHFHGEKVRSMLDPLVKQLCSSYQVEWMTGWLGWDAYWWPKEKVFWRMKGALHIFVQSVKGYWDLRDWHWRERFPGGSIFLELSRFYQFDAFHFFGIKLGYEQSICAQDRAPFFYDAPMNPQVQQTTEKIEVPSPSMQCTWESITLSLSISRIF